MNGLDADSLLAGTEVEVETASGSYRGTLTRPYGKGSDVELRCAAHYVRVHRRSIHRVRAANRTILTDDARALAD